MGSLDDFADFEEQVRIPLFLIASSTDAQGLVPDLEATGLFSIETQKHGEPLPSLTNALLVVEIRLMEAFEDLESIRQFRSQRPLTPVLALSGNDDEEFLAEVYKSGVTHYIPLATPLSILAEQLKAFHKLSEAPRLVEIQNEEMIRSMNAELQAVEEKMRSETEKKLAQGEAESNRRTREILDNLCNGFFIVEKNLSIADVTSLACRSIFNGDIASQTLGDALSLAPGQESYLRNAMEQIFDNFMPLDVNLSLLPKRVQSTQQRTIGLTYTPILDADQAPEKIIVEATDLTDFVRSQEEFARTQRRNETLLRILSERESYADFIADTKRDLQDLRTLASEVLGRRLLHTLKGNVAVMGFDDIAELIHSLESKLEGIEVAKRIAFLQGSAQRIEDKFIAYFKKHSRILQLSWERSMPSYVLSESDFQILAEFVERPEATQREKAKGIVDEARLRSAQSMLSGLDGISSRLATQLGKKVRFRLIGGNLRLDPKRYGHLMKTLVHAVRNACDHGIEAPDERERLGKAAQGIIQFKIEKVDLSKIRISIQDDGGGIKVDKLISKALEKNLLDPASAKALRREDALQLIFRDGLSTADAVSETSGRGVGMACIRQEVENLQGSLKVLSKEHAGTLYEILIPEPTDSEAS